MTMKLHLLVTAAWRWLKSPPTRCARCDQALIPYLPACMSCDAPAPVQLAELPRAWDDLTKPAGAIRVAHLSDLHVGMNGPAPIRPLAIFRMWLDALANAQTDLIVVSGDLVERPGDLFGLEQTHAMLQASGMRWVVVPGNHDIKRPGYHDPFHDIYGPFPRVEEHLGLDVILLDSMGGLTLQERALSERMYGDYVCYTEGRIGQAQLEHVERLLQSRPPRERLLVLHHHVMRQHADLMPHVPRQAGITEDVLGTMKTLMDADALLAWACAQGVTTLMHGHKHLFQQPGMRADGLLVLNAGSSTLRPGSQLGRMLDLLPDGDKVLMNLELPL